MDGMTSYLIGCTLYITVFQAYYLIAMRKTTFFRMNRIVLMSGTFTCMIMPLVNFFLPESVSSLGLITAGHKLYTEIEAFADSVISAGEGPQRGKMIFCIIYFTGAATTMFMTIMSMIRMTEFIRRIPCTEEDGVKIRMTGTDIASFSWCRNIVISRNDIENNPLILAHEKMHVKCWHSFDMMAYSAVTAIQWFNPIVWLVRKELKMLHEYEADALTADKDGHDYQLLLIRKAVGEKQFMAANGFNHSKVKSRISMMNRKRSGKWMKLVYILCLPILAGAICCCSDWKAETVPFDLIEEAPRFQGGDANSFSRWVNRNLRYPESAKDDNAMGRVNVNFTVDESGKVTDVRVLTGVHPALDAEAIRVVSSSPSWEPGMQDGRPIPVSYTFPIIFHLRQP